MRYNHGCKPRNPLNMIIQENHAASKGLLLLYHKMGLSFGKESPNERNQFEI